MKANPNLVVIALLVYKLIILFGCAYITFWKGESYWWWVLAVLLCEISYSQKGKETSINS